MSSVKETKSQIFYRYLKYMLDQPEIAVAFDESCCFQLQLKNDSSVYFVSNFIGEGHSGERLQFSETGKR